VLREDALMVGFLYGYLVGMLVWCTIAILNPQADLWPGFWVSIIMLFFVSMVLLVLTLIDRRSRAQQDKENDGR
jgi:membrane protein implicated in regulation of membrane protease activity